MGEEGFKSGEIEKLDKVLSFKGDVKILKKRYDPTLSDPVKNKFNKDCTTKDIKEFMGVWVKLLARHPNTFIEATLNNIYYYFSIDYGKPIIYIGTKTNGQVYNLENPSSTLCLRELLLKGTSMLKESSMFGWAFSVGTWNYMFLIAAVYVMYKRKYSYLLPMLPVIINLMIAFAGPVAYMRYAME